MIWIPKGSTERHIVYQENHEKTFYGAIIKTKGNLGVMIGDSTDKCMSIVCSNDGGLTWTKTPCN